MKTLRTAMIYPNCDIKTITTAAMVHLNKDIETMRKEMVQLNSHIETLRTVMAHLNNDIETTRTGLVH